MKRYIALLSFVFSLASCTQIKPSNHQPEQQSVAISKNSNDILEIKNITKRDLSAIDSLVVEMGGEPGEYIHQGDSLLLDLTSIKKGGKVSKEDGKIEFFENYSNEAIIHALVDINKQLNNGKAKKTSFMEHFQKLSNTEPIYVAVEDTAEVMSIIQKNKQLLPSDAFICYGVYGAPHIVMIKKANPAPLDSRHIKDASINNENHYSVISIEFTEEGTKKLAELTKANIRKCISIMNGNKLLLNPHVLGEIDNGKTDIALNNDIEWINHIKLAIQIKLAINNRM